MPMIARHAVVLAALTGCLAASSGSAATITVTSTGDSLNADGSTTLREAIVSINNGSDVNADVTATRSGAYGTDDAIHFLIGSGPQMISVSFALPVITKTVALDGTTQPGFQTDPLITIDGSAAGGQINGLVISSTTNTVINATTVRNFGRVGILLADVSDPNVDLTPPVANAQSVIAPLNTPLPLTLTANDPDDTAFTFAISTPPANGTISGFNAQTGALTYTLATGQTGSDSFLFTASEGVNTSIPAMVAIQIVPPPQNFNATAITSTRVDSTWTAVSGFTYQIDRQSPGGGFVQIGTADTNSYSDTTVSPNTAYLYRVRAVTSSGTTGNSNADLATTVMFADTTLAGMTVKAMHLSELRTAVNAVRSLAGMTSQTFTDPATPGTTIKAIHITELRTALGEALDVLGLPAIAYTDLSLTGLPVKSVHFQQLRDATQ